MGIARARGVKLSRAVHHLSGQIAEVEQRMLDRRLQAADRYAEHVTLTELANGDEELLKDLQSALRLL